jgi:hypothetical protein
MCCVKCTNLDGTSTDLTLLESASTPTGQLAFAEKASGRSQTPTGVRSCFHVDSIGLVNVVANIDINK